MESQMIGIAGAREKRHIIFSMMRYLSGLGRTLIVTQDRRFKLLSPEMEGEFSLLDVDIIVCEGSYSILEQDISSDDNINEEDEESDPQYLDGYNYIIFDIVDNIPKQLTSIIILDHIDFYLQELLNSEKMDLKVITNEKSIFISNFEDTIVMKIPIAWNYGELLNSMIEEKSISKIKDKKLESAMMQLIAKTLEISTGALIQISKTAEVPL